MKILPRLPRLLLTVFFLALLGAGLHWVYQRVQENQILRKVVERLSADSRIAEVLVAKSVFNEETKKVETTIKFLEYDSRGKPLEPRYFTFQGNVIQFQCLVVRFQDKLVGAGDKLRGKSAYLFLKVFMLNGKDTREFNLTDTYGIPKGYKVPGLENSFEKKLWEGFWEYALNPKSREQAGIKNAQIEAPGSLFLPGTIYTIRIEHDGGIRIDASPIPEILKGEKV